MLHTKALYNLLRLNVREDPLIPHEPWAVEDLRSLSIEALFARLGKKGLVLDRPRFVGFAENSDTPEELTELLLADSADASTHDPVYLLLFELWRRLMPEKPSLSIFFDEFDHRIDLYDRDLLENDELIQDTLANLQEILEENVDAGVQPQEIFPSLEEESVHDIESFLYDYISDLLDSKNELYASELIEGFAPYMAEPSWFDLLRARLLSVSEVAEANQLVAQILKKSPDLPLLFAILQFLSKAGDRELFVLAAKQALPLLETEEDFSEMLSLVSHYYQLLDLDALDQAVQRLMQRRKGSARGPLNPEDPDLKAFSQMIH